MNQLFIAKGHTPGRDPGAVIEGISEIHQIDRFCSLLRAELDKVPLPYIIVMVPWLSLKEQIKWINHHAKAGDLTFQIHFDIGDESQRTKHPVKVGGYYSSLKGKTIVNNIIKNVNLVCQKYKLVPSLWCRDADESRFGRIGFVDDTIPTAFLLEAGYVASDNKYESVVIDALILSITEKFGIGKRKTS